MVKDTKVRVRFAPSPTGPLHIGSVRTALFNWLFARSEGGVFVLRIEDTDKERSREEFEADIKSGLQWLGMEWDELYRQSDRGEVYKEHLLRLLEENRAYWCFCSKEELKAQNEAMLSQGLAPKYSGKCRSLTKEEADRRISSGEGAVVRLKIPEKELSFEDIIRGKIVFDGALIGDTVIARDLESPLYNFVVVVDDALMEITHVIRGEDHISNTPRQIALGEALGFDMPRFAHLPIILNPDRSKMSKRFADTALREYIQKGYAKEAVINFLALLGWHPEGDREVITKDELIQEFSLKRVQRGGAVFNQDKLDWLSNSYFKQMNMEEFRSQLQEFLPEGWQPNEVMISSVKERIVRLDEAKGLLQFYFEAPDYKTELLSWKGMSQERVTQSLTKTHEMVEGIPERDFKTNKLEERILGLVSSENRGEVLWPLRVALSGLEKSPSPFEIMAALGKKESLRRIEYAQKKIA
ncbi:MAG: glutamate--tRNA ligase [bacterium]|nr:glutamate--tRNA ligase [bacterium]MDZ4231540.1 glutamate--tRNA ligase [Patescibacteria group bacterium]